MYKLLMIMILIATFKTFIAYLIAKLKSCKKEPISAEEIIQFKGLTRNQYEKLVAPIMWDNESYYEQLKFNLQDNIKYNQPNENRINISAKKPNTISIEDYHKQIEEEYESLKELFKNKYSNIS